MVGNAGVRATLRVPQQGETRVTFPLDPMTSYTAGHTSKGGAFRLAFVETTLRHPARAGRGLWQLSVA